MRAFRGGEGVLLAVLAGLVMLLAVWPLLRLAQEAILPGGTLDISVAAKVLSARSTWNATLNSLDAAFFSALLSLVLGTAFALLVGVSDVRAKTLLVFGFVLPLLIPPPITALAWTQLFGPGSALLGALSLAPPPGTPNPIFSREGIILLLGIQHAPLVFLTVRAALRQLPGELVQTAHVCGASTGQAFRLVVLPLLAPALIAGTTLAFVSAIGNFGIAAFVGIPARHTLLPVLIYQRLASFGPQVIAEIAVLSVLVGVIAIIGVLAQTWLTSRSEVATLESGGRPWHVRLGRARPWIEAVSWLLVLLLLVAPLLALVATSLVPAYGVRLGFETATFANYAEVLWRQDVTRRAFANSTLLAGGAALTLVLIAVPLAYLIAWRRSPVARALRPLVDLPYALPGVVLGVACILVFLRPLPILDISIYGTLWIIFAAYLARFLTLALTPVLASFKQLDSVLDEAAQIDGAGIVARLRYIVGPLVAAPAAAGALLVFMTAYNELTVSALLWSAGTETLGVVVFNLEDGGYTVLAAAVAVVCLVAVLALIALLQVLDSRFRLGVLPWSA